VKFVIILLLGVIILALLVRFFYPENMSSPFWMAVKSQENPFKIHRDSAEIAWERGKSFITDENRFMSIKGGPLKISDTLLFIPYPDFYEDYPSKSFHKGTSIAVHRKDSADFVIFKVEWYYSKTEQELGEKELAYYMLTGRSKYDKSLSK
jgi:hypothetical protein